jgi:NAD(P)-dependent dehydrogenase (short-subunit alcohol dehydrogenase family)
VYVCARNNEKGHAGVATAHEELKKYRQESYSEIAGSVEFHELDLATVTSAKNSAEALKEKINSKEKRLDILVANAGVACATQDVVSEDKVERCFAVNCVGHFAFITTLLGIYRHHSVLIVNSRDLYWFLDLIEETATTHGDARITITGSQGYKQATKLDYEAMSRSIPGDGLAYKDIATAFQRYLNSKLGSLYFTMELDKRIRAKGSPNVFVNCCHPGMLRFYSYGK